MLLGSGWACGWEKNRFSAKLILLPMRQELSLFAVVRGEWEEEQTQFIQLHHSMLWGILERCGAWMGSLSSPIGLGKQAFLLYRMELESRGSKLLTYFQDYSRNFLFLKLIWPSGGKDYYSYGHILWLLSLREGKKKSLLNFSEAFECESDYYTKNVESCSHVFYLHCDFNKRP